MTKKTSILLGLIIFAKFIAIFAGSHPFDFATYVYQARSFFEYGINPFFSWNKGLPLLGIFYAQYSIYQFIIHLVSHSFENTVLLHFFYKFVFFACDIFTALYIAKIVKFLTKRTDLARYSALIWLFNPLLFWSIEFQGSYAIVSVFFSTVSLWYFLTQKYFRSIILLAVSVSVYYYSAILLPFYFIKRINDSRTHGFVEACKLVLVFLISILVLYVPYVFNGQLRHGLINSLANHSAPNASQFVTTIQLPTYSLLKFPYYAIHHSFPTNLSSPQLFKFAGLLTLAGVAIVGIFALLKFNTYFRGKAYKIYSRRKSYTNERFIYDLLIAVTIFLLLIGNFQDHYLAWVFPLMIICAIAYGKSYLLRNMLLLSFTVLFIILSAQNIGIYFLDIVPFGTVNFYLQHGQVIQAFCGFIVMVLLAANIFVARYKKSKNTFVQKEDFSWAYVPIGFCLILSAISIYTLVTMFTSYDSSQLGSDDIVYNYKFNPSKIDYSAESNYSKFNVTDLNLDSEQSGAIMLNQFLDNGKSPWFLYNWHGNASGTVAITDNGYKNNKSLTITPQKPLSIQLNLGSKRNVLPVKENYFYQFKVFIKSNQNISKYYSASVRFIDGENNVISASDMSLKPFGEPHDGYWTKYYLNFSPPKNAKFMEPTLTVQIPQQAKITNGSYIQFSDISVAEVTRYQSTRYQDIIANAGNDVLEKYILQKPSKNYFDFQIQIPRDNDAENIKNIYFNNCAAKKIIYDPIDEIFVSRFIPSCYHNNSSNQVSYTTINYPQQPTAQFTLAHKYNTEIKVNYHKDIYMIFVVFGLLTTILIVPALVVVLRKL